MTGFEKLSSEHKYLGSILTIFATNLASIKHMVCYANFLFENISWVRKNENPTEPLAFQIYCRKFRRIRVEHSALLQHGAGPSEPNNLFVTSKNEFSNSRI